ncbi:hypothetical protein [Lysobacter sp. D1-1-M9]|uniref:hypothetical protein n=1 Tax=Novilysobacter longmucuonensis TaxID=3098603 RepID=UPI002FC72485
MSTFSAENLQAAYLQWLSEPDVEDAVAGTITFKRTFNGRPISEKAAADAVRVFGRMLQCHAYGNRFKKGKAWLTFIAVNEGGREPGQKHPHVHFFLEVPEGWSTDGWMEVVRKKIDKIECFGSENCVVKPVVDGGWLDYMFKRSDKNCYADALDIISLWTKSRSN